jgi:hypothetical protein
MADTHCLAEQNLIIAAKYLSNAQLGTRHPHIDMTDCFLRMPGRGCKWPATLPHIKNLFAQFEWFADSRARPRRHHRRQWESHRQQHERTGERAIEGVGMGWLFRTSIEQELSTGLQVVQSSFSLELPGFFSLSKNKHPRTCLQDICGS